MPGPELKEGIEIGNDHKGKKGMKESALPRKDVTLMPGSWGRLRLVRDD